MKEILGPRTMPMTIIPLGIKTVNERIYSLELFQDPPLPCYVQLYDPHPLADNHAVDLSKIVGIMDNLRAEEVNGLTALVGDFHHLETPAYLTMREFMATGYHCTPMGHGTIAEDGTVSDYTLYCFGVCSAPVPETATPV